jgi:hypothetical protein
MSAAVDTDGTQAVGWCALPFPQYAVPEDDDIDGVAFGLRLLADKSPGHGEARVEINFWFFLFVYYGFYNVTALMWITKVFNIYSLNWYVSDPTCSTVYSLSTGGRKA